MLDSGNNANIRPNMRLYYLETILPIVRKINFALERFFGFELSEDITNIPALQPETYEISRSTILISKWRELFLQMKHEKLWL